MGRNSPLSSLILAQGPRPGRIGSSSVIGYIQLAAQGLRGRVLEVSAQLAMLCQPSLGGTIYAGSILDGYLFKLF